MTAWTEERVELLRKLHPEGTSYRVIALELSRLHGPKITRLAVSGKCYRLGLVAPPSQKLTNTRIYVPRGEPRPPKPDRKPPNNGFAAINIVAKAERQARDAERNKLPEERIRDAAFARPWGERGAGQCAYPISGTGADTLSCCAPTQRTYCAACEAVMYQPDQPSMKKTMRIARIAA